MAALDPSDEPVVDDLQRECLKRSAELSVLVDALLARVRAKNQLPPAPASPPPAMAVADPLNEGDSPKTVQRVLAEADEWLVGATSLAERSADAPAQPAYPAEAAAPCIRDGDHRSDEVVWEQLWHPTAEAAIASARQSEAEARRQLADLRRQLAQRQEEPTGVHTHSVMAHSEAATTRHDLASANAEALSAAAFAAGAAFSTLSAAAAGSDPNDPRDVVTGVAAGVEDAVRSLRELFLQWAPMLQLQVFSSAAEQSAFSHGDSASSEEVVLVNFPAAIPTEAASPRSS